MPGPSAKGKSSRPKPKSKPGAGGSSSKPTYTIPDTFFVDIDNAGEWKAKIDFLCEYFKIPDLETRSGLKKVHADFNEIFRQLDTVYSAAQRRGDEGVLGGIVGIWTKMSTDAILRDKLFNEGLLSRIMPLLDLDSTRHMALLALSVVTHHGGVSARKDIARRNPVLLRVMQAHPDDVHVIELATVAISHATSAVVAVEKKPDSALLRELNIRAVLKATVENIRKPLATRYMIDHAISLIANSTQYCSQDCKAVPGLLSLLVACMRSTDLGVRCTAVGGLIRYTHHGSEIDRQHLDPNRLISAVQRGFPPALTEIMVTYGMRRCDTTLTLQCTNSFQNAMMRVVQDRDMVALGQMLAYLIQCTEFSIADGVFEAEGPRGQRETIDVGLPFTRWTDALPHCSAELRLRGSPADLDAADVLDLKFYIIRSRIPDAIAHGQRVVERNPNLAYAYYAISMGADHKQGLRAAKKGLKSKITTPFVRNYLLWRAVEHAGDLGVSTLQNVGADDEQERSEGVAFLWSAWEDAKAFVSEAPPDNRHMQTVLNWYVILTLAIRGPELDEDLHELAEARRKLENSVEFMHMLGLRVWRTQLHLVRELVLQMYPGAATEWGACVKRFDELSARAEGAAPISASKAEDDLAAWLDEMKIEEGEPQETHAHTHAHAQPGGAPKISASSVALYQCSYCSNPSAMLRKCGGCGRTKYCDAQCQKQHWADHKTACKAATRN